MSDALAFAAVTEYLKALLDEGLSEVSSVIGSYKVTSLAPDLIDAGALPGNRLNVFLCQITPSSALRNADLPTRSSAGDQARRPVLAADLHYLLTAYSKEESQAEVMLGQAAYLLHQKPVLTRSDVRDAEEKWALGSDLFLQKLATSGLSAQLETVRVVPQAQSTEELSRLWSAFQTHYRPTLAYVASVLLIEGKGPSRTPLPVLTIGEADRGPISVPSLILPLPLLVRFGMPEKEVTATLAATVTLEGHHLDGTGPQVDFVNLRDNRRLTTSTVQGHTASAISVSLADARDPLNPGRPADEAWAVGSYAAAVRVTKDLEPHERTTNQLVFVLAPSITAIDLSTSGDVLHATVSCAPQVAPGQRVSLLVGDWEIAASDFTAPTGLLEFQGKLPDRIKPGEQHVCRLRVDGVESHFIDRTKTPLAFRPDAQVVIP